MKRGIAIVKELKRAAPAEEEEDSWDEEEEEEEEVQEMKLKSGEEEEDNHPSVGLTLEHTNRTKKLFILTNSAESQDKWFKALDSFAKFS